jgi:signal transduction histidine kinase
MIDISSFAHLGDAALVVDDERRCLQVNEVALALLGALPRSIVLGSAIEELSPLPTGVDIEAVWSDFLRLGAYEGLVDLLRDDGSRRSIQCRARAHVEERAHLIVFRDVTIQSERETTTSDLLRRAELERDKLQAIITDLPIAIVIFGAADFRIEAANDAYLALVGRTEVVGLTLEQMVPEVSPHSIYAYLADVVRNKQRRERREHALLLPGPEGATLRYFTNRFQPLFGDEGAVRQVLVTVLDVTNDVRSRLLVLESAERLRVILDEMPVGANVRDATTGELIINNKASTNILGVELMQRDSAAIESLNARFPDGRLLGPDDHAFRRAMITGKPVRNQIVILNRAGTHEEIVVRSSAAIVEGPGAIAKSGSAHTRSLVVSVVEDITDEYRLLAEHEQTARFAETCVGILAHDLRTPLNAITMGASLLESCVSEAEDVTLVSRIASSARRMDEMVTQLLDLTRTRLAGGIPVESSPVDLVAILSGVLDEIAMANPGVTFSRVLPTELVGDWDGARIAQVVSNVVGNAVQHGDRSRPIAIVLENREITARLTVQSHGPVIPGPVLAEVFDPFRRHSSPRRGKTTGLGLGLYITREIVNAHGGAIRATSTVEDGTVFTIDLPRAADRRAGPAPPTNASRRL